MKELRFLRGLMLVVYLKITAHQLICPLLVAEHRNQTVSESRLLVTDSWFWNGLVHWSTGAKRCWVQS